MSEEKSGRPDGGEEGEPPKRPEAVIYSASPPTAVITLNREERGNAIAADIVDGLHAALDLALDDEAVRAVIITGAGGAFCSGIDLVAAAENEAPSYEELLAEAEELARLLRRLRSYEKVTIAAVNGPALATGCGLATVCDFTLATGSARFGYPEVRTGFVPAVVSVYLRGILSEKQLRELLLTGRIISADDAQELGLVNEVVPAGDLLDRGRELAIEVGRNAPTSIRMTKELLETLPGLEIDRALKAAVEYNARVRESDDCREGLQAFVEKREPSWTSGGEGDPDEAADPEEASDPDVAGDAGDAGPDGGADPEPDSSPTAN